MESGRHTKMVAVGMIVSRSNQRGIEKNSFQCVTLKGGKPSDKTLPLVKNLEDRVLSQGGRLLDKTGYNKFIEESKVLCTVLARGRKSDVWRH
ncbi:unnamed protein product [Scomber scombrus]|uniref:Unnamed protein product n=1 Tax=Scomber scombrus TaxID=13677 RepID=A0AAV1PVW3_SCOSC